MNRPLIFERSSPGRKGYSLSKLDVPSKELTRLVPPAYLRPLPAALPEVSELDVVRHFVNLSKMNFSIDGNFYPLGSCTMKYNPKVNEEAVRRPGFLNLHPLQPQETTQGMLTILYELERSLCKIVGVDAFSLQPSAGAQGELAGLLIMHATHKFRGEKRTKILVPDSAHGTNPASATLAGFSVVQVRSNERGRVDLKHLKQLLDRSCAGLMLTNPNTLGLFEEEILEIAEAVHGAGGLLYYDGANLNPLLGLARPGDMGFDIVHLNTHKTFSTPHGGGGPGAGPVGVKRPLEKFLPVPRVVKEKDGRLSLKNHEAFPQTIGKLSAFYGNVGVLLRAYSYIRALGCEGLLRAGQNAILNANYLLKNLEPYYDLPYPGPCMHEFILSATRQKERGVRALDIAKRLIDFGIHPPTIYFPLIVPEAMMIEPTESESLQTLDQFVETMRFLAQEAEAGPERFQNAPTTTPVGRLDEVTAARQPILRWVKKEQGASHEAEMELTSHASP